MGQLSRRITEPGPPLHILREYAVVGQEHVWIKAASAIGMPQDYIVDA